MNSNPSPSQIPYTSLPPALSEAELVLRAQSGCTQALDVLLSRHWAALIRHARLVCADRTAAQDVCQDACLKAIHDISRLSNPERFCPWLFRFIDSEAMHWKRNLKKDRTQSVEFGTYTIETMNAMMGSESKQDLGILLDLLGVRAGGMPGPRRRAALFMLECYRARLEFPTIRAIAFVARVSQGAAQLYHDEALACWRRFLATVELGLPSPAAAAHPGPPGHPQPNL